MAGGALTMLFKTWHDFITYPVDCYAIKSARARLAVHWWDIKVVDMRKRDPNMRRKRYRMTEPLIYGFASDGNTQGPSYDPFEAMFVTEDGGVVMWTREHVFGIFQELNTVERMYFAYRNPEPGRDDSLRRQRQPEQMRKSWQDFVIYKVYFLMTPEKRFDVDGLLRATNSAGQNDLGTRITLPQIQRDEQDNLEIVEISKFGGIQIWTESVAAFVKHVGSYERVIRLPRNPSDNISGCYSRFMTPADSFILESQAEFHSGVK